MDVHGATQTLPPRVLTVALPADFNDAAVDELDPVLRHHAADGSWQEVRLDGRHVRSVTARGLGLLASVSQLGATRALRVVITGASPQLAAGLALGRLIDRIELGRSDAPMAMADAVGRR